MTSKCKEPENTETSANCIDSKSSLSSCPSPAAGVAKQGQESAFSPMQEPGRSDTQVDREPPALRLPSHTGQVQATPELSGQSVKFL